jgi:pimeloyl-ACP methyl ester carboxylesterase
MLYYESTGNGKTIVFIHGISQSTELWKDLVNEPLLANYHSIRIDLPGHGQSFRSIDPEKDYTLKRMAAHLKDFLFPLNEDYIIVASSLATNLVAEVITQLERCKGLVLTGASVIGPKIIVPEIVKPNPYFEATFTAHPTEEELDGLIGTWAISINSTLKEDFIRIFKDTDPTVRLQLGASIAQADWSDEIANLEQLEYPVAVIYGAKEKIVSPDYLTKTDLKMWRNKIIEIPNAGHCCQLDQPSQLASLIHEYVTAIFRSTDF